LRFSGVAIGKGKEVRGLRQEAGDKKSNVKVQNTDTKHDRGKGGDSKSGLSTLTRIRREKNG
jgi:hypothetical protein